MRAWIFLSFSIILATALINNGIIIGEESNSTKLSNQKSKDLTSEDQVIIKLTESGTTAEAKVNPKNIKVNVGTTVLWESKLPEKVYVQSKPDANHYTGELLSQNYIFPGESYQVVLSQPGTFVYDGSNGFGSFYVRGTITVVNETKEETIPAQTLGNQSANYDIRQIQWTNFTNDLYQFSVEYPSHWKSAIGNRFTGDAPLTAENGNGGSLAPSWIQINVFDDDDQTAKKWAQIEQKNVDNEKGTKIIEPVSCGVYVLDSTPACSFVYAAQDKGDRTTANLQVFVNDNASLTHSIKYRTDSSVYDLESPIVKHLLNSYKLINNQNIE